jgi:hypothetical protein
MAIGRAPQGQTAPTLNIKGHETVQRELSRSFTKQLTGLLQHAGFGGNFTVQVITTGRGGSHKKGLQIGSPAGNRIWGVSLTWQERGNDSCVSMAILAPAGMKPVDFHSKLKKAETEFDYIEEPAPKLDSMRVADTSHLSNGKHTSMDFGPETPKPAPEPSANSNILSMPDSMHVAAEQAATVRFADDATAVELFMDECVPYASPNGLILRTVCSKVLKEHFKYQVTGKIFFALVSREHLEEVPNMPTHYKFGKQWLSKLPVPPKTEQVEATIATNTPPTPPVPEAKPIPSPKILKVGATAASVAEKIAGWEKHVATAANLRVRLTEIEKEIESLDSLKAGALERKARIVASLERPEVLEAERRLEEIQKLVG